ncbi:MAG: hypothetical protein QGG40_04940 [Myxococcota bacterium]|nr:hypothetical protein [Myxococcota bacterium]
MRFRSLELPGHRPWLVALVGSVTGTLAMTWPLAQHPRRRVLGEPQGEAVDHLWSLWAATRDGPLVIETQLVNFPQGYQWVLADPANLPWFLLGLPLGPVAAFNTVQVANLLLCCLSAWFLTRLLLPETCRHRPMTPAFAATVASTLPPLAEGLQTGMTEVQTIGWAALALSMNDSPMIHRFDWPTGLKDQMTLG